MPGLPSLYFLALIPPAPVAQQVVKLKLEVSEKFQSKAALRSPPHITLHMPFRLSGKRLQRLNKLLEHICTGIPPVEVSFSGFGSFVPRVIYINVQESQTLCTLQQHLCTLMAQKLAIHNANYKTQPFHPHVTIGFRDLRKDMFHQAWEYFRNQQFEADCTIRQLSLLKHNGSCWQVSERFELSGK